VTAVLVALIAAAAFATSSVVQQSAAAAIPERSEGGPALLARLVRSPLWIAGIIADLIAYALQIVALHLGQLSLVQPIMALGIVAAIPISTSIRHERVVQAEGLATASMAAGIGMFLVIADPRPGPAVVPADRWVLGILLVLLPAALVALVAGRSGPRWRRSVALVLSTGLLYGLVAAMTKGLADEFARHGAAATLQTWYPYALAVVGAVALQTGQHAFQLAPLAASLPILASSEPTVAVALGLIVFHERLALGPVRLAAIGVALLLMVASVVSLAPSGSRGQGDPVC